MLLSMSLCRRIVILQGMEQWSQKALIKNNGHICSGKKKNIHQGLPGPIQGYFSWECPEKDIFIKNWMIENWMIPRKGYYFYKTLDDRFLSMSITQNCLAYTKRGGKKSSVSKSQSTPSVSTICGPEIEINKAWICHFEISTLVNKSKYM